MGNHLEKEEDTPRYLLVLPSGIVQDRCLFQSGSCSLTNYAMLWLYLFMSNTKKPLFSSSFLILIWKKKKELEQGCKGDVGIWDRVSCNFSGALWKHFSQVWIICQRNVIAYAHKLHFYNNLTLLGKKKGNGVCPAKILTTSSGAHCWAWPAP